MEIVQNIGFKRNAKTGMFNDPSTKVSYESKTLWDILHRSFIN